MTDAMEFDDEISITYRLQIEEITQEPSLQSSGADHIYPQIPQEPASRS